MSEFQGEFAWELVRRDGRSAGGGSLRRREDGDEAVAHSSGRKPTTRWWAKWRRRARTFSRARGATARGDGFEAEDDGRPTMGAAAAAAAAAPARRGGRACARRRRLGPRTPGAFGKEKGEGEGGDKECGFAVGGDDDEDEEEKDRGGGSSNTFGASGEGTPREDVA